MNAADAATSRRRRPYCPYEMRRALAWAFACDAHARGDTAEVERMRARIQAMDASRRLGNCARKRRRLRRRAAWSGVVLLAIWWRTADEPQRAKLLTILDEGPP